MCSSFKRHTGQWNRLEIRLKGQFVFLNHSMDFSAGEGILVSHCLYLDNVCATELVKGELQVVRATIRGLQFAFIDLLCSYFRSILSSVVSVAA